MQFLNAQDAIALEAQKLERDESVGKRIEELTISNRLAAELPSAYRRTLSTVALELAVEEALLDEAEEGRWHSEWMRVWHPQQPFVVIGRGSKLAVEVDCPASFECGVPILRRMSGGAAVVAGPGCLIYAVMLSLQARPQLRMVDELHRYVMQQMLDSLQPLAPALVMDGTCDLVMSNRKTSGNSLRIRRDWALYHGTLLLNMDLAIIDRCLKHPPREPEYRQRRAHSQFVANMNLPADQVISRLVEQWQAGEPTSQLPLSQAKQLAVNKYLSRQWIETGKYED